MQLNTLALMQGWLLKTQGTQSLYIKPPLGKFKSSIYLES
jgi:hypothetical protein